MPDTAGNSDLWQRFAQLSQVCEIRVEAATEPSGWQVTAFRKRGGEGIEATAAHLVEAVAEVLKAAESSGWYSVTH